MITDCMAYWECDPNGAVYLTLRAADNGVLRAAHGMGASARDFAGWEPGDVWTMLTEGERADARLHAGLLNMFNPCEYGYTGFSYRAGERAMRRPPRGYDGYGRRVATPPGLCG